MEKEFVPHPLVEKVAHATHDIVTPANIISLIGLLVSLHGAMHIQETSGVLEFGAGRMLDIADGWVARHTYKSRLGAKVDGSFDKAAVGVAAIEALRYHAAPEVALGIVLASNAINAVSNVYMDRKGTEPETSKFGRLGMITNSYVAFGALLLGHSTGNTALQTGGNVLFAASTPIAAKASYDYTKSALRVRKQHNRQRR